MAEICTPFWQAFLRAKEISFCEVPSEAFAHPSPIMYDWSGSRQSALSASHTIASGGSLVDGTLVADLGTTMAVGYSDLEGGYSYQAYVGVHKVESSVDLSTTPVQIDVLVTLVSSGGTRYDKFLQVDVPYSGDGFNNGAGPTGWQFGDQAPAIWDGAGQFGLDGSNVSGVEVTAINILSQGEGGTSYETRTDVQVALLYASTNMPT